MKSFKHADFFAVAAILILAAAIFYSGAKGASAQVIAIIRQDSEIVRQMTLEADESFVLEDGSAYNEILVIDGEISVIRASCRHQTCVQSGKIQRAGQMIACLENRVSITIEGHDAPDAIVK